MSDHDNYRINEENQQDTASSSNSGIKLNTEVLKQDRHTYMALGDLYQIEIFSDRTYLITEEIKDKKQVEDTRLEHRVFLDQMTQTADSHPEQWLFSAPLMVMRKQDYFSEKQSNDRFWIAGMGVLIIIFIASMIRIQKKRKQRRAEYVNHINF